MERLKFYNSSILHIINMEFRKIVRDENASFVLFLPGKRK